MPKSALKNIPTEVIRSFVAIADTGSLTKAGELLGLTQPAITIQMKRLQTLVGGPVLLRTPSGTVVSELGRLVLEHARRIIQTHDQLLALSGGSSGGTVRIGVSALMMPAFLTTGFRRTDRRFALTAEHSRDIQRGLVEGYIDIGCMFTSTGGEAEIAELIVHRQNVPMVWVKSPDFELSPGEPIPIIALPEDHYIIHPLKRAGLTYRIALHSPDMFARVAALQAGVGITAAPPGIKLPDLVTTEDYGLPGIPPVQAYIAARTSLDRGHVDSVLPHLIGMLNVLGRRPD